MALQAGPATALTFVIAVRNLSLTDISVEFWVKTTQSNDYPRFFQHNGADTEQHSYGAMYSAETNAIGLIGGGSTGYLNSSDQ